MIARFFEGKIMSLSPAGYRPGPGSTSIDNLAVILAIDRTSVDF